MSDITLYDHPISGNCYKIRLLLGLLGLDYRRVHVDIMAGESLTPEFTRLSPRGQIPLLFDGEVRIWDSMAILVYLARRYGEEGWLPRDAVGEAQVMQWLALAGNELLYGLARARAVFLLGRPFDLEQCQRDSKLGLVALESRLIEGEWLAGCGPTIADIACYPYVTLAEQGEVSLAPYPAVRAWLERVAALPGWVAMDA